MKQLLPSSQLPVLDLRPKSKFTHCFSAFSSYTVLFVNGNAFGQEKGCEIHQEKKVLWESTLAWVFDGKETVY